LAVSRNSTLAHTDNLNGAGDVQKPLQNKAKRRTVSLSDTVRHHPSKQWSRGDSNPRANANSSKKSIDSQRSAAPGAVPRAEGDFDVKQAVDDAGLRRVIAAWNELPDAVRKGIIAMVEASMREK
jgi:hypothetical protein